MVLPISTHEQPVSETGIWVNYSEHGMQTMNLTQEVRQTILEKRKKVNSQYGDLLTGNRRAHGIYLQ